MVTSVEVRVVEDRERGRRPTYPRGARRLWHQTAAPSINTGTHSHRITVALYIGAMGTCAFLVNMLKRNQTNATKLKQSMQGIHTRIPN